MHFGHRPPQRNLKDTAHFFFSDDRSSASSADPLVSDSHFRGKQARAEADAVPIRPALSWRSRHVSREERRAFQEEITGGNLRRMFWFILICLPISVGIFIYDHRPSVYPEHLDFWSVFDLGLALIFLALTFAARKRGGPLSWKRGLVLSYYGYCLISMTGYYFASYRHYGDNQSYTLGVMMTAVLFRLPPREFLTLLGVNHLVFSILAYSMDAESSRVFASMVGGLDAFLVGCLAAHFLFTKEWQDFQKGRLLAERNREMAKANAQLHERNEEMNEVMAIAAHDLRSPLIAVKSLFDLLQTEAEWKREPYSRVLSECSQSCGDMLGLIKRLLEAHAAEHGSRSLCIQSVEVKALLEHSVRKFLAAARRRSIQLETTFSEDDFRIATDPGALEQAVDNLLSNAVKFSPGGSAIKVTLFQRDDACHIEIADEGLGIPEEERDSLFGKFRKGKKAPLDGTPGTGLGLFIVRQVMENLGGLAAFEPRLPHGALFRLTLPLRRPF